MSRYDDLTAACFEVLVDLRTPSVAFMLRFDDTHRRMRGLVEAMQRRGLELGVPREDLLELSYAVTVTADELAMESGNDELRRNWVSRPIALALFMEGVPGSNFFGRLESISADPRRDDVTRVYLRCIELGFMGMYRTADGAAKLQAIYDAAVAALRARERR